MCELLDTFLYICVTILYLMEFFDIGKYIQELQKWFFFTYLVIACQLLNFPHILCHLCLAILRLSVLICTINVINREENRWCLEKKFCKSCYIEYCYYYKEKYLLIYIILTEYANFVVEHKLHSCSFWCFLKLNNYFQLYLHVQLAVIVNFSNFVLRFLTGWYRIWIIA